MATISISKKVNMETCEVGMFRLPGLKFDKSLPEELVAEMNEWCRTNHCGTMMNNWLWSFKTAAQRDWFLLRWSDEIPKIED